MFRLTFITWEPYHRRSDLLSQHLGATSHYVCYGRPGRVAEAPARYALQALRTWHLLAIEQPEVIIVANPPLAAVLAVAAFARRSGARYAIDSHSGAFLSRKWRWALGLHRRLSRDALITLVHNESQAQIVRGWGCRTLVLGFTPGRYPAGEPWTLARPFNVAVVSTFKEDEPTGAILEAARRTSDICYYITGDSSRADPRLLHGLPANCRLTGFLPYASYVGLLRQADAVLDLTTHDNTLLMGAFEAISIGTPLIVSDWPLLRSTFPLGTVYVPNTAEGIAAGVERARHDREQLRGDIARLRAALEEEWEMKLAELRGALFDGMSRAASPVSR